MLCTSVIVAEPMNYCFLNVFFCYRGYFCLSGLIFGPNSDPLHFVKKTEQNLADMLGDWLNFFYSTLIDLSIP